MLIKVYDEEGYKSHDTREVVGIVHGREGRKAATILRNRLLKAGVLVAFEYQGAKEVSYDAGERSTEGRARYTLRDKVTTPVRDFTQDLPEALELYDDDFDWDAYEERQQQEKEVSEAVLRTFVSDYVSM